MLPLQPPLPLASYFRFQFDAGSHSSTWMSESLVGLIVMATRQNAGRLAKPPPLPLPLAAASVNSPAPMDAAMVMVVSCSLRDARLSQVAAFAAGVRAIVKASRKLGIRIFRIIPPGFVNTIQIIGRG